MEGKKAVLLPVAAEPPPCVQYLADFIFIFRSVSENADIVILCPTAEEMRIMTRILMHL